MGFPILKKWHFYIEPTPRLLLFPYMKSVCQCFSVIEKLEIENIWVGYRIWDTMGRSVTVTLERWPRDKKLANEMAVTFSGYETLPPIGWHHPLWLACLKKVRDCINSNDLWGQVTIFRNTTFLNYSRMLLLLLLLLFCIRPGGSSHSGEHMRFYCVVFITLGSLQLCWVLLWSLLWCWLLFPVYPHLLRIFPCIQRFARILLLLSGTFGGCVPGFPFVFLQNLQKRSFLHPFS